MIKHAIDNLQLSKAEWRWKVQWWQAGTLKRNDPVKKNIQKENQKPKKQKNNKAGYTATLVACGCAGAVLEKVTKAYGQEK